MARDYVCLYHSYLDAIQALGDAERGRLLTAMLEYSITGATGHLSGNERFIFPMVKAQIDRDREKYEAKCQKNSENGRKATNATERHQTPPNATQGKDKGKGEGKDKDKDKDKGKGDNSPPDGGAPAKEAKKSFGAYGWVKLTDSDYNRLLNDLGEAEVKRCIAYVDESAQTTGNKNHWRDWNLTVRRCHRDGWGIKTNAPSVSTSNSRIPGPQMRKDMEWMEAFLQEQGGKA